MSIPEIIELIDKEISTRRTLKMQMVGNLHPNIVQYEIEKLIQAKQVLGLIR